MTEQEFSSQLNKFGVIDYKKPLGKQQDMRTSSYLGHKLIDDTVLCKKTRTKGQKSTNRTYQEDAILEAHKTTDYRANYVWKSADPDQMRNVSLDGKVLYIKPFFDCNLKFLKRPMRPASSVTHSDYLWQPLTETSRPVRNHIPTPVSYTKITIDRNKPGYSKYLDPAATTTSLDFCYRSPKDIMSGIAAKDNITFWNWKDIETRNKNVFRTKDEQLCDKLPAKDCTKRRCEFANMVRAVPNSGLTTEFRENYLKPIERAVVVDDRYIKHNSTVGGQ